MKLTRLNADSAWLFEIDGTRLLVDPWLDGPAIVGLPAIHRATLGGPAVPIGEVPPAHALLLSHPYPDHTQAATLACLPKDLPVLASPIAGFFAARHGGFREVRRLGDRTFGEPATVFGRISIAYCRAGRLAPTHNVYVLKGLDSGETLLYSVHGMRLAGPQLAAVEAEIGPRLDVLVCSFTHLDLPFYLGGVANLGEAAALDLVDRFRPRWVLQTHDGEKPDTGFISKVAKITRCADVPAALLRCGLLARHAAPPVGEAWTPA